MTSSPTVLDEIEVCFFIILAPFCVLFMSSLFSKFLCKTLALIRQCEGTSLRSACKENDKLLCIDISSVASNWGNT